MSNLSPHGVKIVLPIILDSLQEAASSWRSKMAALQILGSAAYLAPKQLSASLPMIVPKMTEAFGDTHAKVRDASKGALSDIAGVIKNPEIQAMSKMLLNALADPSKYTNEALELSISCEFLNSPSERKLDASPLANDS